MAEPGARALQPGTATTAAALDAVREQAAQWVVRLHESPLEERARQQAECEAWQARDARHRQVFAQMERMWAAVQPEARQRRYRRGAAAALGVVLMMVLGWQLPWVSWSADYRSGVGEVRTVALADGSTLVLDTDSAVDVRYDDKVRTIRVRRGEVWARVQPDGRPFRIESRDGSAVALGTRYSLRLARDYSEVAVEESRVQVTPARASAQGVTLKAHQSVRLTTAAVISEAAVNPARFSWVERRLVFTDRPLSEVVEALRRYRPGLLLLREQPETEQLRFTGVLPTDDTDAALALLLEALPLHSTRLTPYVVWLSAAGS